MVSCLCTCVTLQKDTSLQIFLTIYYGQLLATFFYDYFLRNVVRLFFDRMEANILANICLGIVAIAVIVWMITCVWGRVKLFLIISAIVLLVIFIIRCVNGYFDIHEKSRYYDRRSYTIELVVTIAQIAVHLFGIAATWLLSKRSV
jgi:hypothetical protein